MPIVAASVEEMYRKLKAKLGHVIPEFELKEKAEIAFEINRIKKEKDAIILGHNYMEPALFHTVPDFSGDSLELSRKAAEVECSTIVFCGVRFMAETAKILSPERTVLLPTTKGGCSLAASITAEDVRNLKKKYPGVPVVTYVNTYAEVKAESDICCTSGNAKAVVESLEGDRVIFIPDEFLAGNIARETGKEIIFPSKEEDWLEKESQRDFQVVGWNGRCEVHEEFSVEDIENARKQFPGVVVLAHPECPPDVVEASDYSASTSAMIRYIQDHDADHYMLMTECSMADNIIAENPEKEMVRICSIRCPHMNEITLEQVLESLEKNQYQIEVPEEIRVKALKAVNRMLEIS
jgi:quinolinate synthase